MDKFGLNDAASCSVGKKTVSNFIPQGRVKIELIRNGNVIQEFEQPNLIVNQGKNYILDVMFNGGTQIANNSWFVGLISNSGYSAIVAGDTAASHAGWSEFISYDETGRVGWGCGAASSQAVTNTTPLTFTISASGTVKGVFVISNSTKGGTSGTLWAAALFSSDVVVADNDELRVTYTLSC